MENIYIPFDECLLLNYLLGKTGEEETRKISEWLHSNEDHRRYLDQLEKVWVESGRLTPAPVAVDVDAAWERMLERITGSERTSQTRSLRYVWSVAAILLVSFGIYLAAKLILAPPKMIEIASIAGVLKDTLPDGTLVSLNKASRLTYPENFGKKERLVRLSGEAFFHVEHDARHPFVVEAGKAQIKVLGTAFDVKAFPGTDVEVSVEQGIVTLFTIDPSTGDTLSVLLSAGMRGTLPAGSMQPRQMEQPRSDRLFWLDRTLEFRQTELSEVFGVLSGHFDISIRAASPEILKCRLSATFHDEPLQTILEVIATSFDLSLKNEGNNWLFYGKGCNE
jgi:transmembrane sensor